MTDKTTRAEYLQHFRGTDENQDRQKEALKQALDIRKFEIELYWKRASYFWTFIAATFAGYFLMQKDGQRAPFESSYVITCLGFVFSLSWYFVNRGSKAWQRNWEVQVDLLEDEIMGPLYKSGLNRYSYRFWDIAGGFPFSPTSINHILGLFVTFVWLLLVARTLTQADWTNRSHVAVALGMSAVALTTVALLATRGRTVQSDEQLAIDHRKREYHDVSS